MGDILARLTPPGKGAIACVGLAGDAAWPAVRELFRRPDGSTLPDAVATPSLWHGRFGDPAVGVDDVVLFVRRLDPPVVEVHCHGGREIVRLLMATIADRGLDVVEPAEWTRQVDGADAGATLDVLMRCSTVRTAAIALDQRAGAFRRAVAEIDALVAAGKDHEAEARRQRLRDLAPVARHLARPWIVAVAGAPNVGKSSLVNALAGFERSIVSPIPGATRDVVSTPVALDGWPVELLDTAGLRESSDDLESQGIARAARAHASADLVLWVLDATAPPTLDPPPGTLIVINKIDQPATWDVSTYAAIRTSATTGVGIDELARTIVARLVPFAPIPGEAVGIIEHAT